MTLRQIQFGSGGQNLPPPWENYDNEVDIRKSLKFPDACCSYVYCSHLIEHVTPKEAWNFFEECHRILAPGGVLRVAFPDIVRIASHMTLDYAAAVKKDGFGDGSEQDAIKAVIFAHGHQSVWTEDSMMTVLDTIGFHSLPWQVGVSNHPELRGVEQHGKVVGEAIAKVETSVVEGTKYE